MSASIPHDKLSNHWQCCWHVKTLVVSCSSILSRPAAEDFSGLSANEPLNPEPQVLNRLWVHFDIVPVGEGCTAQVFPVDSVGS